MDISTYQESIQLFANHNHDLGPFLLIHRLGKHFGDLSEKIYNILAETNGEIDKEGNIKLAISLGDMVNDISCIASDINIDMSDVLNINMQKVQMANKDKFNNIDNFK